MRPLETIKATCFGILLLHAIAACSSEAQPSSPSDSNLGYQDAPDPLRSHRDHQTSQQPENTAQEPVMVGGTFLVCADLEIPAEADGNQQWFGCRLESEAGDKRFDIPVQASDLAVYNGMQEALEDIQLASPDDFWHWYVDYTGNEREALAVIATLPAAEGDQSLAMRTHVLPHYPD